MADASNSTRQKRARAELLTRKRNVAPKDSIDREIKAATRQGRRIQMENMSPPLPIDEQQLSYKHEYNLRTLHRLIMRNIPTSVIAEQMNLSPHTIVTMRTELTRRLRNEIKNIDAYTFFGNTMALYDEVRGMALRAASSDKTPPTVQATNLSVALAAETAKVRFLETAGFFDHNRFTPPKREATDSVESGRRRLGVIFDAVQQVMADGETAYAVADALGDESDIDDDIRVL